MSGHGFGYMESIGPDQDSAPRLTIRAGGTGRTGTVIACALAALGMAEDEVLKYMATVNAARRKSPGWPESDWQQSQVAAFVPNNA